MSSGTPIRTVQQNVPTPSPDLPSNPFRSIPVENTVGPALAAGGDAVMNVALRQQQQQNAIDASAAANQFQDQVGKVKTEILNSGISANDMATNFKNSTNDLITAFTSRDSSPYPNVAPQLAVILRNQVAPHLQSFPSEALERVSHDLDFKFNQETSAAAATIGQNYTIGGTADAPTFQLNADGLDAMRRQAAAIDAAYPPQARQPDNQYYRDLLARKAALQTGMSIAQDHPSLVDSYIKQHAAVLTPEQQMQLTNQATAAINLPMRQLDAANAATRAQLMTQFKNQIANPAKYGPLDPAKVDQARQFRLIDDGDYQQVMGYQYMSPGNPTAIAAMQKQIAGTTDENDLETLRGAINGPLNAELYGKGAIPLNAAIENQKRQLTTVEGQQRRLDNDQIKRAFQSLPGVTAVGIGPDFYNRLAAIKGLPTMNDLRTNTINDYNALTYGVSDPAKLRASRVKAIQDNQPDLEAVGLGKYVKPATPPPPIRPLSADDARRVIRLAREKGYIP